MAGRGTKGGKSGAGKGKAAGGTTRRKSAPARAGAAKAKTPRKPAAAKSRAARKPARARKPAAARRRGGAKRRSFARRVGYYAAVAAVWGLVLAAGFVGVMAVGLPDIDEAIAETRRPGITVTAADGAVLANFGEVYGAYVPVEELPGVLVDAVLAIEDRRFYDHFGLDPLGLARAAAVNAGAGRVVQGGSTLTQQIAKNIFLAPERTFRRKVQEALLAVWLELRFSKRELLGIYLNRVYLGAGCFGVEAAARRYFGKSARDLGLAEAAILAGLPKAPSRYAPTRDPAAARARAAVVLDAMAAAGSISAARAAAAKAEPIAPPGAASGGATRYFADWVADRVSDFVGPPRDDLVVLTTLHPAAQAAAERAVRAAAQRHDGQAALVAMSPDGAVRAMIGGVSYAASQFNRATQARRQPGSAFKIAVFAAALADGHAPGSTVDDSPVSVGSWSPRNYAGVYRGRISLASAFAHSSNSVAVQLAERVGRGAVRAMARRLGIGGELPDGPSIALGTGETTLLELASAYATVANGGRGAIPHGILEIRDRSGAVLYRRSGSGSGRVLAPDVADGLDRLLSAVVREGTGRRAALDGPAAGKTGTSQDSRDAWFVGYRPGLAAGVWMGHDDSRPMRDVTGGGLPAETWREFMTLYPPAAS